VQLPQSAKLLAKRSDARLGQALSEYLILTALIAVGSIAVVQILGKNLQSRLGMVASAIGGENKKITAEKVKEEHYEIRDLGDFNEAMQDNQSGK